MARFIVMPFHWASDMNPSFALARKLQARGHEIRYLAIADVEERIRAQGFEVTPIFEGVFPKGALAAQEARAAAGRPDGAAAFRARVRGVCDALRAGELDRAARAARADGLIVSSGTPWVGVAAPKTGLPVIGFSSTLISIQDPIVPPFSSPLIPGRSRFFRARTWLAWRKVSLVHSLIGRGWDITGDLLALARDRGFPFERIDLRVQTWPRLSLPELIFCPRELDFPRARVPEGAHFVEASIDARRRDGGFPWERLREGKPLIYCALGTVAPTIRRGPVARFIQVFLDAIASRPDWQAVVSIGRAVPADHFRRPANALLVPDAPQVEVLRRASLFVTHGGFNSVKESVYFGVPMIVLPIFYDQRGNAARVVYHGLGARGDLKRISPDGIGALMSAALENPGAFERSRRMSTVFVEAERRGPSVDILEAALKSRSQIHA